MEDKSKNNSVGVVVRVTMITVLVIIILLILGMFLLARIPSVGGSFGFGFFSGSSKGSAIKDVVIDVEPQIVYRIDDHRFFTLEQYKDCTHGGFVYYHDTKRNIKNLITSGARDTDPQNEITIDYENDIMAFKGKFIFAASDNVIAYPVRHRNYKYGYENYYIAYRDIETPSNNTGVEISSNINSAIVTDGMIYVKRFLRDSSYREYYDPNNYRLVDDSEINLKGASLDDHFYCDNNIKPRSVKFISD